MAKFIEIECVWCNKKFQKLNWMHTQSLKKQRKECCSMSCASKQKVNDGVFLNTKWGETRRDEFSDFRLYLLHIRNRIKDNKKHKSSTHTDLTLEHLKELWEKQKGICPYSGIKLEHMKSYATNAIYSASVDKIDYKKSYTIGNIQFVSRSINFMKAKLSHEQTIEMCKLIAKNYN